MSIFDLIKTLFTSYLLHCHSNSLLFASSRGTNESIITFMCTFIETKMFAIIYNMKCLQAVAV
jgi:hypothetical protein